MYVLVHCLTSSFCKAKTSLLRGTAAIRGGTAIAVDFRLHKLPHQFKDEVHCCLVVLLPQFQLFTAKVVIRNTGDKRLHPFHKAVHITLADILYKASYPYTCLTERYIGIRRQQILQKAVSDFIIRKAKPVEPDIACVLLALPPDKSVIPIHPTQHFHPSREQNSVLL